MSLIAKVLLLVPILALSGGETDPNKRLEALSLGAGAFDLGRPSEAGEGSLELRLAPATFYGLQPVVGLAGTTDSGFLGWVGLRREFRLGASRWFLSPSVSLAGYERGNGKDLGSTLEFRSGLDVMARVGRGALGIGYHHLSNAGFSDRNPGANSLTLKWTWFLSRNP